MGESPGNEAWSWTSRSPKPVIWCDPPRPLGRRPRLVHFRAIPPLGAAHAAIRNWCAAHNHRLAGPNWEVYGHWEADWDVNPSRIRTDIFVPVGSRCVVDWLTGTRWLSAAGKLIAVVEAVEVEREGFSPLMERLCQPSP